MQPNDAGQKIDKKAVVIAAVVTVIAVVALLCGIVLFTGVFDDWLGLNTERGNSGGNLANMGMVVGYGDSFFVANPAEDYSLYRFPDEFSRVRENVRGSHLNIIGEHLYFIDESNGSAPARLNLSSGEYVLLSDMPALALSVEDTWVYFLNADTNIIFKVDINGKNSAPVTVDMAAMFCVWNSVIYYGNLDDGEKLYSITSDGSNRKKISDRPASGLIISDDRIYFADRSDNYSLYKAKLDGSGAERIIDAVCVSTNIADNQIYYSSANDGNALYRADLDGKNQEKLVDEPAFALQVYGNWIYFCSEDGGLRRVGTAGGKVERIF